MFLVRWGYSIGLTQKRKRVTKKQMLYLVDIVSKWTGYLYYSKFTRF